MAQIDNIAADFLGKWSSWLYQSISSDCPVKLSVAVMTSALSLLLLLSPALGYAKQGPQPLNLQLQGIITDAGNQTYQMSGGHVFSAFVNGVPLNVQGANLDYSLKAQVTGLDTSGTLAIHLTGKTPSGKIDLKGSVAIGGAIPATVFPITVTDLGEVISCTTDCNSQIPLLFTGVGSFTLKVGENHESEGNQQTGDNKANLVLPFAIESAYWNPFGGPIVLTSLDSPTSPSIVIIADYKAATISWDAVQVAGQFAGVLGSNTPAGGQFLLQTKSSENLVSGAERDRGTIAFADTNPASLTASGDYAGTTFIPNTNTADCSVVFNLPAGTCTFTGAFSSGSFRMSSDVARIKGTYDTAWSVPSLLTMTSVIATVFAVGSD